MKEQMKREGVDRGNGIFCSIKSASDVPSDPPNYFLARRIPSPDRKREEESQSSRRKERNDESGRRIKGNTWKRECPIREM